MPNPATGTVPPWMAIKIPNHPMALNKLGYKVLTFHLREYDRVFGNTYTDIESEPLYHVPPNDPLTLLAVGDKVEVFFRSSNQTKTVTVIEIDTHWDGVMDGYIGRIRVEESVPGLSQLPNVIGNQDDDDSIVITNNINSIVPQSYNVNWKDLLGSSFKDMLQTPEFKKVLKEVMEEEKRKQDPSKST